jgi:tetratricopeptide (TPR) repeat protein
LTDEYDWLFASNVIDTLLTVMSRFYARLGVDPQTAPLVQALERSRRKLTEKRPQTGPLPAQSLLLLFERAWQQHQAGQTKEAQAAFETIINDPVARQGAAHNAVMKEAVVRSGEIAGRHYDALGEKKKAIALYRHVLSVEPSPIIARRLIVLLSRSGRLAEAAGLAETAIVSRANLFARLPANRHIAALKSELFLEP